MPQDACISHQTPIKRTVTVIKYLIFGSVDSLTISRLMGVSRCWHEKRSDIPFRAGPDGRMPDGPGGDNSESRLTPSACNGCIIMRFFLDYTTKDRTLYDYAGDEFMSSKDAFDFAQSTAQALKNSLDGGWIGWSVEVRNAEGRTFFSLPVDTAGELQPGITETPT